jgi:hypothetical protein
MMTARCPRAALSGYLLPGFEAPAASARSENRPQHQNRISVPSRGAASFLRVGRTGVAAVRTLGWVAGFGFSPSGAAVWGVHGPEVAGTDFGDGVDGPSGISVPQYGS